MPRLSCLQVLNCRTLPEQQFAFARVDEVAAEQHEVGLQPQRLGDGLATVDGFVDDLVVRVHAEQRLQPVAQQGVVFGDDDAMAHDFTAVAGAGALPLAARGTNRKRQAEYCVAPSKDSRPAGKPLRRIGASSERL